MRQFKNGMLMNENRGTWAKFSLAQRQQRNKQVEITTTDSAEYCRKSRHTPRLVHKPLCDCIRMEHMPAPQLLNSGQLYFTFDTQY